MKLVATTILLVASACDAFSSIHSSTVSQCFIGKARGGSNVDSESHLSSSALRLSSTETASYVQGPKVVMDQLPIVYVYDHCPFCVRVRLALGIKNVKHLVQFMANDDIPTPTNLLGKKIAPIFVSVELLMFERQIKRLQM